MFKLGFGLGRWRQKLNFLSQFFMLLTLTVLSTSCWAQPWVQPILQNNWNFYKNQHMPNQERVQSQNYGGTISEGQSYALARALFHNDPATFDKVLKWTTANMKRPNDNLIGWRWGQRSNGSWGLMEVENATDADEDIAYYLIFAAERWGKPEYLTQAKAIINDLWRLNVHQVQGKYYIDPGTWSGFREGILTLNPSYFAAYAYRLFAKIDTAHPWNALADNIYPALEACSNLTATKLPPNWCGVRYDTGQIVFSDVQGDGARDFTWDAHRVFWRAGVDAALGDVAAQNYLKNHTFLLDYFAQNNRLPEGFTVDGRPRNNPNSAFTLSAAVAQYHYLNPNGSQAFYNRTLGPLYNATTGHFQDAGNDFMQSVTWFGLRNITGPSFVLAEGGSGGGSTGGGGTTSPPPTCPTVPPECQVCHGGGGSGTGGALAAPSNLRAATQQPSSWQKLVRLDWQDNASSETGYIVQRSSTSATEGFQTVDTVGRGSQAWAQFLPFNRTETLYYRVAAVGTGNTLSGFSNVVTVAPF
jgi:endo-1,4-beta-D-glucanase Y